MTNSKLVPKNTKSSKKSKNFQKSLNFSKKPQFEKKDKLWIILAFLANLFFLRFFENFALFGYFWKFLDFM
jgi:hypothetical protein